MMVTKDRILKLVSKAVKSIPHEWMPDLPPGKYTGGAPEWHGFEHAIWTLGEEVRQYILKSKSLRKDGKR